MLGITTWSLIALSALTYGDPLEAGSVKTRLDDLPMRGVHDASQGEWVRLDGVISGVLHHQPAEAPSGASCVAFLSVPKRFRHRGQARADGVPFIMSVCGVPVVVPRGPRMALGPPRETGEHLLRVGEEVAVAGVLTRQRHGRGLGSASGYRGSGGATLTLVPHHKTGMMFLAKRSLLAEVADCACEAR